MQNLKTIEHLSANEFGAFVMPGWVIADVIILPFHEIFISFELKQDQRRAEQSLVWGCTLVLGYINAEGKETEGLP